MESSAKDLQFRELKDTILQLKNMISDQTETIRSLRLVIEQKDLHDLELQKRISEQDEQIRVQNEQIAYLTKKLFGSSSEKTKGDFPGQLSLFDEAEIEQDPSLSEEEKSTVVREHTRKKKPSHKDQYKGLKVNRIVIPLDPADQICPNCGTQMELIGEDYVRYELVFHPAVCEINEYYSQHYGCPECKQGLNNAEKPVIIKAPVPAALIPNSPASSSTVSWTMYQKYANSIPLYRQEKDWTQYGAPVSRTSLANWIIYCSKTYFQPVYDYLHRELVRRTFLMADETRIQVLHEPDRAAQSQSFMWLYRSGEDGLPVIILYEYTQTRNGDNAVTFLKGFEGYLETDGYQGYNKLPGIKRCTCWSHIRRYFIEAVPKGKEFDYSQPAVQGVQYCDRLFRIERDISQKYAGDYEKRKKLRLEKEKPVLQAFWSWLEQLHPVRNSRMDKALTYVLNRKDTAETYLEDGRCSFSNNLSENAIRPFTVGRKNWLFSNSTKGAEASAVVYTMVEMAKAHNLNVFKYLKYLLDQRPDASWTDDQLAELMPWSEKLQSIKIECEL